MDAREQAMKEFNQVRIKDIVVSIEIQGLSKRFYQKTEENKHLGTDRRCYGCARKFVVGDFVSIAITDRGNLCFGDCCIDQLEED